MILTEQLEDDVNKNPQQHKRRALESLHKKAKKRKLLKTGENPEDVLKENENKEELKESFTILGGYSSIKNTEVQRHLPKWLAQPKLISTDLKNDVCTIEEMNDLDEILLEKLKSGGVNYFFPVQKELMPWLLTRTVLRPRDFCVCAPTGSGKTLAYVLPIVKKLSTRLVPKIRALIVVPVQELAIQVTNVFKHYCKGTVLKVESATGKTPFSVEQEKLVNSERMHLGLPSKSLVDILVTTPGRLVDHLQNTKGFDLRYLKFLVMDEADRMIDNMQNNWLYHLGKHANLDDKNDPIIPYARQCKFPQKLLFSATLSQDPELLKKLNLFQPILFTTMSEKSNSNKTEDYVGSFVTPTELKEKYIISDPANKPLVLCEIFKMKWRYILCFTKSALEAHKLSKLLSILNPEVNITEISSLLPTQKREEILNGFSSGSINVLICSDVMARGVDINGVKFVISYDPPKDIRGYIHRVGRTGRAGAKGKAITILSSSQAPAFHQMLAENNKSDVKQMAVNEENLKNMIPEYKNALQQLKVLLQKEETEQQEKVKNEKAFSEGNKNRNRYKKNQKKKNRKNNITNNL